MNQKDYYSILALGKNASQQEIRAAYRKLAMTMITCSLC